jgi:hypothetical protein
VGTSAAPSLLGGLTQGCRCKKQRAESITSATSSASCPSSTYWGYGGIPASQRFLWLFGYGSGTESHTSGKIFSSYSCFLPD